MDGLTDSGLNVRHGEPGKFFGMLKTVLKHRPDYLHLDWLHSYYMRRREWMTWIQFPFFVLQVFTVSQILKVKLVWTLHNIFPHDKPTHGPYKWARQYFASQCQWIRVFDEETISRAAEALKVTANKFRVVPEGSYVGYYPDEISPEEARDKLKLPGDKKIILYLGLIKPYKGVLELIEDFKRAHLKNTLLLIAGWSLDSNYWSLVKDASDHSDILLNEGFIPDNDLQYYYNAADLVVLPFQRIENSGSAILAMGFKKPILAPRKGVLKSRLAQQDELLYENGGLASILNQSLLMKPEELRIFGQLNFEALNKYKWQDFGRLFIN